MEHGYCVRSNAVVARIGNTGACGWVEGTVTTVGELKALGDDLPEQARALAQELRTLFTGLEVSLNRYAARLHRDPGAVSRFLSGTRVPPWGFVRGLLVESTKHNQGAPPTVPVVEHLRRLHRAALEAGGSPAHQAQLLQDRLADADRDAERTLLRERELEEALQAAQHRIAQLAVREREWEAADAERREAHGAEVDAYRQELGTLREVHAALLEEIKRLKGDLRTAHRRRMTAEQRCEELERQLESALGDGSPQPDTELESLRTDYAAERRRAEVLQEQLEQLQHAVPPVDGAVLDGMSPHQGAATLREMEPKQADSTLGEMSPNQAGATPETMDVTALDALTHPEMGYSALLDALNAGDLKEVTTVLDVMDGHQAVVLLDTLNAGDPVRGAAQLRRMDTSRAATLLGGMDAGHAAAVLEVMDTGHAADLLSRMDAGRAANAVFMLARVNLARASTVVSMLAGVDPTRTTELLDVIRAARQRSSTAQSRSIGGRESKRSS